MKHKLHIAGAIFAPLFLLASVAVFGSSQSVAAACDNCDVTPDMLTHATCGTPTPSLRDYLEVKEIVAEVESAPAVLVTIPVYFHVITTDSGVGDYADSLMHSQIAHINGAFGGSQSSGAANTNFRFTLAGIDRTANTAWYNAGINTPDEVAMKTALHVGTAETLNIYIKLSDVGGYATFPWWYAGSPLLDGIVLTSANATDGLAHEVGHWLGLFHTFQGGCDQYNDFVTDTPAERNPNRLCPLPRNLDSCTGKTFPGKDPTNNFMDYTPDACRDRFTAGQSARMDAFYNAQRAGQ